MTPRLFRRGLLSLLAGCAVLVMACDFHYKAAVVTVEDEVVVRVLPTAKPVYDHPVQISPDELRSLLKEVQVEFKANWLQRLIAGALKPEPLFDPATLDRIAPSLSTALKKAGPRERIVFYVAQRRASDRRDITSGSFFVRDGNLTLALANFQNRVDVIPGLATYDRTVPEVAVAPQRFTLNFAEEKYVVDVKHNFMEGVIGMFDTATPKLTVAYAQFLQDKSRGASR